MKPFQNLAEIRTPDGSRLSLHEHDGEYFLKLNGRQLMSTTATSSELLLAQLSCDGLRVSDLCLGTMTFGEDWGWGAARDEARKIYDTYREAGGNQRKNMVQAVEAGRLAGSKRGLIDRGEKKTLDEGARKWCSRLDENRSSEAAEPG